MFRSAIILAAVLATPATAAEQSKFDLRCTGTLATKSMVRDTSESYEDHYRIDLAARKWCESECKALHDIEQLQPTQITLTSKEDKTPGDSSLTSNFIDRETGAHHALSTSDNRLTGPIILKWEGTCAKEAFSGFPAFETKF